MQSTRIDHAEKRLAAPAERSALMFREVLQSLARPAQPRRLPFADYSPAGLSPAATAVVTLLADADAPWWLASDVAARTAQDHLTFATGSPMANAPAAAGFLCGGWPALKLEALPTAPIGDADYPDKGATLVIEVSSFEQGQSAKLAGPGLAAPLKLTVDGVDDSFWSLISANRQRYPLGLDIILCAGDRIVGLPRSISRVD